jgi:hypothetical protein
MNMSLNKKLVFEICHTVTMVISSLFIAYPDHKNEK